MILVKSSNSDKLSNRVVHVSVQLFSNEDLALQMTTELSLLHIMVSSLKNMMKNVLIECGLNSSGSEESANKHMVSIVPIFVILFSNYHTANQKAIAAREYVGGKKNSIVMSRRYPVLYDFFGSLTRFENFLSSFTTSLMQFMCVYSIQP